jgi:uncharacterized alkaline shock family protein YloU
MEERMADMGYAGRTTIAPGVLLTIARLAALSVEGVSRIAAVPGGFNRLLRRHGEAEGIRAEVEDEVVYLDIYLTIHQRFNARELSREVQQQVARAIFEMLGMQVGHVNIHIEDVDFD